MEGFLKLSTAVNVTVLMIDSSDHVTGKTGLSAGLTIYSTKAAGTPATITPTVTELDATNVKGVYKLAFTTAHTDTLGELQIHITATGADPSDIKWQVATYLPGEAATLQADQSVNATKVGGTSQTGRDLGASVLLSSGTGTGQLDFTSGVVKANATQWLGGTIPAVNVTGVPLIDLKYTLGTISPATAGSVRSDAVTGAVGSVTGAVGSVTGLTASDVGAIKTKTDFLPSATAGAAGGVFIAGTNAATAITTALTANVIGNVTGNLSGSVGSVTGAVGSVTGAVGSVTGSVGSVAIGGIAAASFAAGAIDAAAIATDAIDADALKDDAVTEIQSGLSTLTAAGVRTAVGLATANLDTQLDALPTAAENSDAVWDEANAGHLGAGSTGLALNSAGSAGDPWITALPGAYGAGTAGFIVGTNIDALISSRTKPADTQAAVTTVTNLTNAPTAGDLTAAMKASVNAEADTALSDYDGPTNAELATALGTADDAVLAQVALVKAKTDLIPASPAAVGDVPTAAQNADKILGRNLAGGSDGTRTVKDALRSLRNKTSITAGTLTVTEEDDTTPAWTAVITTAPGDPLTSIDPA